MNLRRPGRAEDGQMLAIFAICLVAIIGMTGLVIDGGLTYVQRREQQNVADAAALAGAYAYVNSANQNDAVPAAQAAAAANGYTTGTDGVTVDVTSSMVDGAIQVVATVTKPHRNYFSGIMGFTSWPVTTTAAAVGGMPNAAQGAMPIIFNKKAFPHAVGPQAEMEWDEPGVGNEDVPQTASQFNWTVFCTANGGGNGNPGHGNGGCNADSNTVRDLINNHGHSTTVNLDDDIGPMNAGAHATLFSDLADLVGTPNNEFPVAIVDDSGAMVGWAMFHLTGSVGGSTKQIRGYFVSPVNRGVLKVVQGVGAGGNYGDTTVHLTN
jgi:Flp pilus assembly protein TadG